jgi:hypothetical protein
MSHSPGNRNRILQPITSQSIEQTNWIRLGKSPKFPVMKTQQQMLVYTLGAGMKYCATLQRKVMAKWRWGYSVWGIPCCVNRQGGGCHLGHSLADPLRHWRTAPVDYNRWFPVSFGWPTRQARKLAASEYLDIHTLDACAFSARTELATQQNWSVHSRRCSEIHARFEF